MKSVLLTAAKEVVETTCKLTLIAAAGGAFGFGATLGFVLAARAMP